MMTTTIEPAETDVPQPSKFQVMPPLADDDFAALKADIQANGVLIPVEVDEDGNVLDGHHRVSACTELGIDWRATVKVREGLTEAEKRRHARRPQHQASAPHRRAEARAGRAAAGRRAGAVGSRRSRRTWG